MSNSPNVKTKTLFTYLCWAIFIAMTGITGCKMSVIPELYLTDLRDVAVNGTEGVSVPTTLLFQIPSSSECEKYTAQVTEVMGSSFTGFTAKGCEDRGMESYLMANVSLPLVNSPEAWKEAESLFGIVLLAKEGEISAYMALDRGKYAVLSERVKSEFYQDLELESSTIKYVINNDSQKTKSFTISDCFLNAEPVDSEEFSIERRQRVDVQLSDVKVASLVKNGGTPFDDYASGVGEKPTKWRPGFLHPDSPDTVNFREYRAPLVVVHKKVRYPVKDSGLCFDVA